MALIVEVLVILTCILPQPSRGFGMGPPLGACVDMWPKDHGADAQTSDPPYTITVSKNTYSPGETLTVVVNTTINKEIQFFEGLLVQARRANCFHQQYEEAVGSFGLQAGETFLGLLDCQGGRNSAVGHIAHEHIVDRTFTWTAPANSVGHIYFRATVARRQKTFWTQVTSNFVRDASESSSPKVCPIQTRRSVDACTNSAMHWNLSRCLLLLVIMVSASKFWN
ncbi:putative defense protein [Mizuhopecten yessoensis]|uniref:Defense protein n=1 Tax=Mizuhopecten yessoensis TaxID=6573 RepID=A0A210PNT8_MIZYE|nr:putative defense protein [Mizuhopecten yessoensis]OWF38106.1 defense protein [Mizuhopecten yessoensis]